MLPVGGDTEATPNGVELKAERRKPSGEIHCDIEDIPSLTGVLAHFRLHEFSVIRGTPDAKPEI
jgi:hypothetical protein